MRGRPAPTTTTTSRLSCVLRSSSPTRSSCVALATFPVRGGVNVRNGEGRRIRVGPLLVRPDSMSRSVGIASAPARVAGIERLRVRQPELHVLTEGLGDTARTVRTAAVQRGAGIIVLAGEDADRIGVRRAAGGL